MFLTASSQARSALILKIRRTQTTDTQSGSLRFLIRDRGVSPPRPRDWFRS